MVSEASEAPERIAHQFDANRSIVDALAKRVAAHPPRLMMTCARGSSDHAATYAQYLFELYAGLPSASLPPSIASVYDARINLADVLFLVISQSGESPDLIAGAGWARKRGATVVAMVNAESSPVADAADVVIPLHAGPEISVAATKSYLASLSAIAQLVAALSRDADLAQAVHDLPYALARARDLDWSSAIDFLKDATNAFVVGRGPGLAGASEIALKFKETSAIHAEAVSSAEIMHGPLGLLHPGLPVLVTGQNDETLKSVKTLVEVLTEKGATVLPAFEGAPGPHALPVVEGLHPAIAPLASVQSFYPAASALAIVRGFNPDQPQHLRKVTKTN
jgi:glucosamine--fructose-6-phosphate aminotransferase (isomerizing)